MSKLNLIDDDKPIASGHYRSGSYRLIARKRRRWGSRSVSSRSSDRSWTLICYSVNASATYGTCSDFPVAMGTDSSRELFGNEDVNWSSNVSEAKNSRKDIDGEVGSGEKEHLNFGFGVTGCSDNNGNESGYGSELGHLGDVEFGHGDELEEEQDETRLLFWGD